MQNGVLLGTPFCIAAIVISGSRRSTSPAPVGS